MVVLQIVMQKIIQVVIQVVTQIVTKRLSLYIMFGCQVFFCFTVKEKFCPLLDTFYPRVWLSSPNLMPEARAHVSKVGVASGYTHALRASVNYVPNTHTAAVIIVPESYG